MTGFKKKFFFILLVFILPVFPLTGDELEEVKQVTTHPALDYSPSVSSDGKWLAFTSERSGNLDIWVKLLPRGHEFQVTFHQAEDTDPVWAPDGSALVFVSKRRDAQGDLWMLRLDLEKGVPRGKPVQLTRHLGMDRDPSWSPDGRYVVYVSDENGQPNLRILKIASGQSESLTLSGGIEPHWSLQGSWIVFTSFRFDPGGDLCIISTDNPEKPDVPGRVFPVTWGPFLDCQANWSPDGKSLVFVRYDRDTDGDGVVTPGDNGSIWEKMLVQDGPVIPEKISLGTQEIQITTEAFDDQEPCWSIDNEIIFSSSRAKALDCWSMPASGLFYRQPDAQAQYSRVLEKFGEAVTKPGLYQAILGYRRVLDYFPEDSVWIARSLVQIGEIYQVLGYQQKARDHFEATILGYPNQEREVALAELKLALLEDESIEARAARCERVIESLPENSSLASEAWIVLGGLYLRQGKTGQALLAFGHVIENMPSSPLSAQAELEIGDLLTHEGQLDAGRQRYLKVQKEFERNPLWRQRAAERLFSQVQGSPDEKIRMYQEIIDQAGDIPSLVAEAQLDIGRLLIGEKLYDQAIRELERVETIVPDLWAHAEARMLLAGAHAARGDDLKGIMLLEEVIRDYSLVEGGRFYDQSRETLFNLLFTSAERLQANQDLALAEVRYRKALEIHPEDVQVYRGLIETIYKRGRIESVVQEVQARVKDQPRNPVLLYALGLAYSYWGESQKQSSKLEISNTLLNDALSEDYRLIYPYRTMGYNYELMERLRNEEEQQKPGTLKRIGTWFTAPVRWLAGLMPFGAEEKTELYYEKAIEALMTALELNDENANPRMEAQISQNLANNFYNLGEFGFKRAYQYYQLRLAIDTTFSNALEKAVVYEKAGHCGSYINDEINTSTYLTRAIQTFSDLGKPADVLRNQARLAMFYQVSGKYEQAISMLETMLAQEQRTGNSAGMELGNRNIAYNYHLMGEPEDALKYAKRAESILLKRNIPIKPRKRSALRVEVFGLSIPVWRMEEIGGASAEGFTPADELALVYSLVGQSHERLKHFPEALDYEKKRLEIFLKLKDRLAERITLNRIGRLYYKMADFGRAWDHFYESWQMCRKKKDLRGRWVNTVNLSNLAVVLLSNYKDERYVPYAELALQEELNAIKQAETGDPMQLVIIYSNLGTLRTLKLRKELQKDGQDKDVEQVMTTLKEVENCYDLFHQGLEICRKQGYTKEEGVFLKNLAEVAELAGDDPAAYEYLKQCRELLVKEGNDEGLWRVLYSIGNLMKKEAVLISIPEKERRDPIQLYREAIDLLEVLPIEEENSEERLSGRDERWKIYLDAAWESIRSGDPEQGLVFLEKGRMKTVADIMARRPPALRRERHKIVWGNIRYIRTRLEEIRRKLEQINVPQEIEKLLQERKGYEQEYRSLMNRIVEEDGTLGYLAGARPFLLGEIQELIAEDEVVIAYAMDDHQTYAYSVEPDTLLCQVIPIKMESLYEKVEEMLGQIATDSISITTITELYQILLRSLEKVFEKKTKVVIVPDGILWQLPFEALSDGAHLFSDNRMVIYLPSLAAYRLVWEKRRINQDDGLFVGDPLDASYIASMQQTAQVVSRLGQEATEERIRDDMKTADLIQFERWAVYQEDPLTSHMVFYAGGADDGYIRADEIFSWDMRASLALLPSSQTSHAYEWKGTTVFFYGLLYAGVPTVVSGRWQAPREVKKTFYDELYGSLGQEAASTAFQKARDHLRERYPQVRDWAAFQYIGYAGMNNQAKMQFARENLVHTVLEGRAFEGRGEFQDGIEAFEKALDMAIAMGDTQSVQRIYQEIIRTSVSGALYATAADYQNRVREIAERGGDRQGVWNSLRNLVAFYMRDRKYDEAVKVKQEEIQFIESGDMLSLAGSYEELSFIHSAGRDYRDAADWVSKAIEIYEKEGDDFGLARSLIRRGRYELEGDNYWNAQSDLSRGVQILEFFTGQQALDTRLGDLASAYQFLGLTYERLARFQEAAEYQQKGIDLFTRLNRPQKVAEGNQYLANLYWQMGDYRQASNHQKAATEAFEAAGDKSLIAVAYSTQGLINMSLGDLPGARKNVFRALSLAEESNSLENQATILKNMGLIALQDADFRQAFDYFHRASTIDSSLIFRRGLASDYRNLGVLQLYLENPGKGLPFLREGLRLSREIGDRRNEVQSYYGLGQIYRAMQDYRPSLAALDSGLTQADDLAIPEVQWRLYRERAKTYQDMKQDEEALKDLRHAVDIVEGLRAELKVESFKQGFLDNKMDLYADLIQQLLRMNRIQEAYDFVERAKSRNFIDLLGNQDLILTKAHGELLEREKKVRIEVQEAMERLAWYAEAAVTPKMLEEKQQWQTELEKRRKAYEEVLISIQSDNPELASMVSVDPWDYQRIQGLLPDSTALLEYFITAGKLYSWLIIPGEIMAREDILGKEMLESTIRHFRENIQAHLSVEIESRQLFQWLILPWSKQLKNISRLIVIPHGILHYIPFSALMDEEGLYLLDRMAVTLAPSGTVLGYCMEKGGAPASGDETLLAMSNPQLGSPSFDLPFAEKEVKSLRRSFNNVTAFFGKDVTERKVREEVGAYDLIHFACHGTYTAESPLFSALLLTQEGEDDGRLEAHEIFGLDLNCNLVTLSACETGLSQITGGDEIIGLARSFIFAGTPSIITSLWKVDDLATAVMVKRFYRYLSMGMSRDRALQRAQLLVKDELNGHPAFWAAFNLTGDFR